MRKLLCQLTVLIAGFCTHPGVMAQTGEEEKAATYSRMHVAFTSFSRLGVSNSKYARCVESVNYQDAGLRHKIVYINGLLYADDGKQHDLKAGDGILTSREAFPYDNKSHIIPAGTYRPYKEDILACDELFVHGEDPGLESKFKIKCKVIWVPCSKMALLDSIACDIAGWPWGYFTLVDCEIEGGN